jgi:peptide-methionine (R)-S-oxide reductase
MDDALIALTMSRIRIGIGVTAVLFPGLLTRGLTGRKATGVEPMFARMLGARDLALGLGTVIAIDRGAPVRGWIEGAAMADSVDALAAVIAHKRITKNALRGTLALAGGAALAGAYLSRRLDPAPAAHPHQPEAVITGHPEP